ncbi:MAG: sulfatase-like hydrolase/transferase, partial [Lentisphaeria bacterium]|nr:sulfatase-like hydrolase/transferase [Lentisphaeria bacterium]
VPAEGFYTSVANVDFALRFLAEARQTGKPWFLYIAFNAPHAPLQPLEADYRKYLGRYDAGWDAIRAARVGRQAALGLFGQAVEAAPRPGHIPAWESLSAEWHDWERRRMAAYAGMIDRIDQETGRLIADLRRQGELDNTLILFLSDNGACPYDRKSIGRDREPFEPTVTWSDSTGWAWTRNTPFRYYKQNQFEGGAITPAIVHWPAGLKARPGGLVHAPAHLVDILPTLAEVAGVPIPESWPGREPTPLAGISLAPLLAGRPLPSRPPIHLLFGSDRGLRDGDWKLVSFRSQPWELYHLAGDRTELHNLAARHPERVERMAAAWQEMSAKVLLAPEREYAPVAPQATAQTHPEWTDFSDPGASSERKRGARGTKTPGEGAGTDGSIRARIGTRLRIEGTQLVLDCEGPDPGLAFDALPAMGDEGPYTLTFRLSSTAGGSGEIYWTTDGRTTLPKGGHLEVAVTHDGQWRTVTLAIPETRRLHALRLDPCAAAGTVRIESLELRSASGGTLAAWP